MRKRLAGLMRRLANRLDPPKPVVGHWIPHVYNSAGTSQIHVKWADR